MRWTMEPVKSEWVRKGQNKIIFEADVNAGLVAIRNVVFFFHRNVD